MKSISRRAVLQALVCGIAGCLLPSRRAFAVDQSAFLVAPRGTIRSDLTNLKGKTVCVGSKLYDDPQSIYQKVLGERGAAIITVPVSERIPAMEHGVCNALLFVSANKDFPQFEEELKVFFPSLAYYDFVRFPTR